MNLTRLALVAACSVSLAGCEKPKQAAQPVASAATTPQPDDWSLANRAPVREPVAVDKGALAAASTGWPLVVAQLTELRRSGIGLTAKLLLRNEGVESQRPAFIFANVHLVDRATGTKYDVLKDQDGYRASANPYYHDRFFADLDPGADVTVAMTFAAPPPAVTTVDLEIPDISPFTAVSIQDH